MHLHEITIGDQEFWDSVVMNNDKELNIVITTNKRIVYRDLIHFVDVQGLDFHFNDPKYYKAEHNLYVVGNWELLDDGSHEDWTLAGTSAPYNEQHRIKLRLIRMEIPNPMAGVRLLQVLINRRGEV